LSGLAFAACGGGEEEAVNAAASEIELARYLPKDAELVETVNVAEVRQELDLPEDANAAPTDDGFLRRGDSAMVRLFGLTTRSFPMVSDAYVTNFSGDGASPLDGTLIRAAASANDSLSIVSTSESFDDVAAKLEATGYTLERALYVAGSKVPDGVSPVVADAGNGRVIFARSKREATEVLDRIDGEAKPGAAARAVEAANGSVRIALTPPGGSSCVEALAAAQSADGDGGVLAFGISGSKPDADRFDPKVLVALDTGTPSVVVDAMLVPFNVIKPTGKATEPVDEVFISSDVREVTGSERIPTRFDLPQSDAYDCP